MMSVAAYLAFDHWRLPDLTPDAAFSAGMVAVYFTASHASTFGTQVLILAAVSLLLVLTLSLATWMLTTLKLPTLLAGLLVTLANYSLVFWLNDSSTSQTLDLRQAIPHSLRLGGLSTAQHFFLLSLLVSLLSLFAVSFVDRSSIGIRLYLSRRTRDPAVAKSIGLSTVGYALLAMAIYNAIALVAGVGFALQSSYSGVSLLTAITPGLFCMFIVRAVRETAASPQLFATRVPLRTTGHLLVRISQSMTFVMSALAILAAAITAVRFQLRWYATPGMLSALTALGTILVWFAVSSLARLLGKSSGGGDDATL